MGSAELTEKIVSYIEENLKEELTWEKLAEELNYSKFYLARIFKARTGTTLYQYIQSRRLESAAGKLAETKQPVVEIAMETGYGSQQAFTRAFRYKYECTPQEYRKNRKQNIRSIKGISLRLADGIGISPEKNFTERNRTGTGRAMAAISSGYAKGRAAA